MHHRCKHAKRKSKWNLQQYQRQNTRGNRWRQQCVPTPPPPAPQGCMLQLRISWAAPQCWPTHCRLWWPPPQAAEQALHAVYVLATATLPEVISESDLVCMAVSFESLAVYRGYKLAKHKSKWNLRLVQQSKHLFYLSKRSMLPHFYTLLCCQSAGSADPHRSNSPWWHCCQYARYARRKLSHFLGKLLALHRQCDKLPQTLWRFSEMLNKYLLT